MKPLYPLCLVLALAACSDTPSPQTTPDAASSTQSVASMADARLPETATFTLSRHHWQLIAATAADGTPIDALLARPDQPLTLDFSARGMAIRNTCNNMHGSYRVEGSTLHVGQLATTLMACAEPEVTALDYAVAGRLQGNMDIHIDRTRPAPRLVLVNADGVRLEFTGVTASESAAN